MQIRTFALIILCLFPSFLSGMEKQNALLNDLESLLCKETGSTVLHTAIQQRRHPLVIQTLLQVSNACINIQDKEGETPLHKCFYIQSKDENTIAYTMWTASKLFLAGANPDIANKAGKTAKDLQQTILPGSTLFERDIAEKISLAIKID